VVNVVVHCNRAKKGNKNQRHASNGRSRFAFSGINPRRWPRTCTCCCFQKDPCKAALRADAQLFPAVFQALRKIDTDAFIRKGRVYGGGLYKMEPKELGRLAAEPVLQAMGRWQPVRQGMLFAER